MTNRYKLVCYDQEHYRVPLQEAVGEASSRNYDLSKYYYDFSKLLEVKEEIEKLIPNESGYYLAPYVYDNVESIEYKRLDKEMKADIQSLEKMILGEKGVGITEALGVTPGKAAKYFKELEADERRRRILKNQDKMFKWIDEQDAEISKEDFQNAFKRLVLEEDDKNV